MKYVTVSIILFITLWQAKNHLFRGYEYKKRQSIVGQNNDLLGFKGAQMPDSDKNQDFVSSLKEKIARNLTDIESRDDLSVDEK